MFCPDVRADQTPPKRELKVSDLKVRDQTLLQLGLSPTAVLHLKFENDDLNRECRFFIHYRVIVMLCADVNVPAPLDPAVLARAEDLPIPPQYEEPPASSHAETAKPAKSSSSSSGTVSGTKVPKWLKLGPSECIATVLRCIFTTSSTDK